jgi:hypothetical protein
VGAEVQSVDIILDDDPRLLAGAVAAAAFYASAADCGEAELSGLRRAVREACANAFTRQPATAARIILRLGKYADRLEVEIGSADAAGFEKPAGSPSRTGAHASGSAVAGVDRLQWETRDGIPVTRLTKFFSRPAHTA